MHPSDELALVDWAASCFDDPLKFVQEAFAWDEGDLEGWTGPDEWQADILATIRDRLQAGMGAQEAIDGALRIAVASGHGIGKSATAAFIILWAMSTREHLAGVVTANTGAQLQDKTWRELSVWHKRAINSHWFRWTATRFYQVDHAETWFVAAVPWSKERPEAFAGLHAQHVLILYDEASAIDDIIWETTEGATTTAGAIWVAFGNPTRNSGRFRECFGRFRHRWITRQIDSRTAKAANKAQLQQWIDDYGEDSDFVRIRVRGIFPRAGSNQFIASDVVEAAQDRVAEVDKYAPLVLGVDIARFGDDQSVIRFRAGRDAQTFQPVKWRDRDTVFSARKVAEAITTYKPQAVFIDGGGVGGGVVDSLRAWGYRVIEVNFGEAASDPKQYANKRAEMYGDLREWLKTGSIDGDKELRDDLIGPEYGFDKNGAIQLEKKEDMKKRGLASPDNGDALALTFAAPVPRLDSGLALESNRNTVAKTEWSMFG